MLAATPLQAATLIAWAELPADTFIPGPTSGQFIKAANGREIPFIDQQPVQGFSALLAADTDRFYALTDNGFGAKSNSPDYLLGWYLLEPHFRRADGGIGDIVVKKVIQLSDPAGFLSYKLIRSDDRILTGADLDPESFRQTPDGNFWIGDEFFPALLKFDPQGKLLAAPYTLPGLVSNDHPLGIDATLPGSRGFEGMGQSKDGLWLYPMLEGALHGAQPGLNIYSFDVARQKFVNADAAQPSYRYRLDEDSTAIGDLTLLSDTSGLVIERDSKQGVQARSKKIYRIDFDSVDVDGFLNKTLVADLLNIKDPHDLNRDGDGAFRFSFWTIEGLVVLNATTLAIANDNNYPFDNARSPDRPDGTEFILLEVAPLWE